MKHMVKRIGFITYIFIINLLHQLNAKVLLLVTCHLHFWQNDRGLLVLHATAVTWGSNLVFNAQLTINVLFYVCSHQGDIIIRPQNQQHVLYCTNLPAGL